MSLSIGGFYTNTYESCNTNSYSTPDDFELDNQPMEYRTWLMEKLKSVGANPTDLADASQETLIQPTIQRIIKGTTLRMRLLSNLNKYTTRFGGDFFACFRR